MRTPKLAVLPFMAMQFVGIALMGQMTDSTPILIAAAFLGMSVGAGPVVQPFVLYRYFGQRAQSEVFGASMIGIILGAGAGPVLVGGLFDRTGNYADGLLVMSAIAMITVVLAALLPRYKYETVVPPDSAHAPT